MPLDISKDTFDPAKQYRSVRFQQQKPLFDYDFNEGYDLLLDTHDAVTVQLAEDTELLGSGGRTTPAASGALRAVDVKAGIATHVGTVIRIPAATDLAVFSGGVSSGTQTSCVYVKWRDVEVDSTTDSDLQGDISGTTYEGAGRIKREVEVAVNEGAAGAPTIAGWSTFFIATVVHDFDAHGLTIRQADITSREYGVTPGELSGYGASRTLTLRSNAPANEGAFYFNTRSVTRDAGAPLFTFAEYGVNKMQFVDGKLVVTGNVEVSGTISNGGAGTLDADTLDGLDSTYLLDVGNATGTLADARLTSNIPKKDASNSFTAHATFGAGKIVFPTDANGAIELGDSAAALGTVQPFIDFHYGVGGTQDYNARIHNNGDKYLTIQFASTGGRLVVTNGGLHLGGQEVLTEARVLQNVTIDAAGLDRGTLADARLSTNVPLKNATNVFSVQQQIARTTYTDPAFYTSVVGDAQARLSITAAGAMEWGPGNAVRDTNLYRSAVNTLRTDYNLVVGANLTVLGLGTQNFSGPLKLTGDFGTAQTAGAIQVDHTASSNANVLDVSRSGVRRFSIQSEVSTANTRFLTATGTAGSEVFTTALTIHNATGYSQVATRLGVGIHPDHPLHVSGNVQLGGGVTGVGAAPNASYQLLVASGAVARNALWAENAASATVPVVVVRGGNTPGANANLQDWRLSDNSVVLAVTRTGALDIVGQVQPATPPSGRVRVFYNSSTSKMQFVDDTGTLRDMGGADTTQALTWLATQTFRASGVGEVKAVFEAVSGQTTDILQVKDGSGVTKARFSSVGDMVFQGSTAADVLNLGNNNIIGVNCLKFTDPGANEGLEWVGGNSWKVWESPDDLSNASGNLQFVTGSTRRATFTTLGQLDLAAADGTTPIKTASTTKVENLNADLLDGKHDFDLEAFSARVAGMVYRMIADRLHLNGVAGVY